MHSIVYHLVKGEYISLLTSISSLLQQCIKLPGIHAEREDTLSLRLVSKLPDLRSGYVNRTLHSLWLAEPVRNWGCAPPKKTDHEGAGRVFTQSVKIPSPYAW